MRRAVCMTLRWTRHALLCVAVFLLSFWWVHTLRGGAGDIPHIYFTYQSVLIYQSDMALLLAVSVWMVERLVCAGRLRFGPRGVWWAALGLIGASALSAFTSVDGILTVAITLHLALLAGLYLMLINDGLYVPVLLGLWFGVIVVFQSVVAIGQVWTQSTEFLRPLNLLWPGALTAETRGASVVMNAAGERWLRAYGTLPHPNILGGMLLIYLGAALARWLAGGRRVWLGILALGASTLLLTFSRAAGLGLLASAASAWWMPHGSKAQLRSAVLAGALAAILTALLLWPYWLTRVDIGSPANPLERASLLERSLLVGYGLEAWRAQPVTGVGAGGFVQWAARHAPEGRSFEPVHNTLLLMLAETGVVGGIAVIAAVGVFLWRVWSRREVMSAAEAAWAAVLSGVCVTGLFDHLWWTQPPARTLFVMAVALWTVEQGRYNVGDPLPKGEAVYETL